jgi:hypothetical protein
MNNNSLALKRFMTHGVVPGPSLSMSPAYTVSVLGHSPSGWPVVGPPLQRYKFRSRHGVGTFTMHVMPQTPAALVKT